jgi:hypothetical protein
MRKKWIILSTVVLLPFSVYMSWNALTDLQHGNLITNIGECRQESMRFQGAERVRVFVAALDKIQTGPVSRAVRAEFEHYKALWNASLSTYDKTGSFGDYDKEITASAQRLKDL